MHQGTAGRHAQLSPPPQFQDLVLAATGHGAAVGAPVHAAGGARDGSVGWSVGWLTAHPSDLWQAAATALLHRQRRLVLEPPTACAPEHLVGMAGQVHQQLLAAQVPHLFGGSDIGAGGVSGANLTGRSACGAALRSGHPHVAP